MFKGYEVTLQSEEVTDVPNGASNGRTRDQPGFTPSYCKTSQGPGKLVPTALIALHYVEACPNEEAVEKMKEFVAKCVFGEQPGAHRYVGPGYWGTTWDNPWGTFRISCVHRLLLNSLAFSFQQ